MISILVPTFLKGVLLAALFGAIQSTVSSVLNSTSTMFTIDIYQEIYKKDSSSDHYVKTGKVVGAIFLVISIVFAIILATETKVNLFILIQALYVFIAPPFSALFLLGMLWKRVGGKDALVTVIAGFAMAGFLKFLEFGMLADSSSEFANFIKPFANQGLITWVFSMIVCIISSLITARPDENQVSKDLTFNIKGSALKQGLGTKWYNKIFTWWLLNVIILIVIVLIFSVVLE